jgi:hypothetical protein
VLVGASSFRSTNHFLDDDLASPQGSNHPPLLDKELQLYIIYLL